MFKRDIYLRLFCSVLGGFYINQVFEKLNFTDWGMSLEDRF